MARRRRQLFAEQLVVRLVFVGRRGRRHEVDRRGRPGEMQAARDLRRAPVRRADTEPESEEDAEDATVSEFSYPVFSKESVHLFHHAIFRPFLDTTLLHVLTAFTPPLPSISHQDLFSIYHVFLFAINNKQTKILFMQILIQFQCLLDC